MQHPFNQADGFDVLLPVERRAQTKTRHGVCHRDLRHTLTLEFAPNRLFGCRVSQREVVVDGDANRRQAKSVLADAMKELNDKCRIGSRRQRTGIVVAVRSCHVGVGGTASGTSGQQFFGQPAQVFDERQLQHARPCPQLANRQRRDPLVTIQELDEVLPIETTVAVPDQFDGNRVDPSMSDMLTGGQRRERPRVRARQIPADIGNFGCDEVEVIEEPVRCGHHELSLPDVVRQSAIRGAQHADVVLESRKRISGAAARVGIDGESGRERERTLLEPLDAQELVA